MTRGRRSSPDAAIGLWPGAAVSADLVRARRWVAGAVAVLVLGAAVLLGAAPAALASPGHGPPRQSAADVVARPGNGTSARSVVVGRAASEVREDASSAAVLRSWGRAVSAQEQADSLRTTVEVAKDGSVLVTEQIRWRFPDGEERHGIFRDVTVRAGYRDSQTQYRYYELSGVEVSSPSGAPTDISISDRGAVRRIRIGSPSETVTGTADYVVRYRLGRVVNDIGDGTAELLYNLVDTANGFPQRQVRATVVGPGAATAADCFVGERGATERCAATAGLTSTFEVRDLGAEEGATVVTSYPRDAFGDLTPDLRDGDPAAATGGTVSPRVSQALSWLTVGTGVLLPLLATGLMGLLVWSRGRDERYAGLTPGVSPGLGGASPVVVGGPAPTVAVQFTPPPGVQPGMVGTIVDEDAGLVDVTATIVDLAVRGHLSLAREDQGTFRADDWLLTRTPPPAGAPPLAGYEQVLLDALFASGERVALSQLKNSFAPTLAAVRRLMYEEVVERGWFRRSPESQRSGWMMLGTVVAIGSLTLGVFLWGPASGLFADTRLPVAPALVLAGGGVVTGIVIRALGRRMAARTAEGSAVLAQSLGFERYLATAEANQIRWEEAQQVFSRFLPYAIVFGLADRWARVFDEVAAAAAAAGHAVSLPVWYAGAWGAGHGFGEVASGMDSFSTVAAGTFVSTPGSSGSSGFGGGGFSGGGGGGASGGSW
ncbi:MAG: DUF2207 domain-containing protein [Dermatophilaceae bacterium]